MNKPDTLHCNSRVGRQGFRGDQARLLPYLFFYLAQLLLRALALDKAIPPRTTLQLCAVHKDRPMGK